MQETFLKNHHCWSLNLPHQNLFLFLFSRIYEKRAPKALGEKNKRKRSLMLNTQKEQSWRAGSEWEREWGEQEITAQNFLEKNWIKNTVDARCFVTFFSSSLALTRVCLCVSMMIAASRHEWNRNFINFILCNGFE